MGHTPLQHEADIVHLSADELVTHLEDVGRLPVYSGDDIVATFARVVRYDLAMVALYLPGDPPVDRSNPLVGTTLIVEAADVATRTLPALRKIAGMQRQETITAFVREGRRLKVPISRRTVEEGLQREKWMGNVEEVVEATGLLLPLLRLAQTAVAHRHSLVLRYEEPLDPAGNGRSHFLAAQAPALLAAIIFATLFLTIALLDGTLWSGGFVFSRFLLTFFLLAAGFLLPLWTAQLLLWAYARHQGIAVDFISARQARLRRPSRLCPFLLSLPPRTITLAAFYQPGPGRTKPLPKPTVIYLFLFLAGFLLLLGLLPLFSQMAWLAQLYGAFWVATLIFWLSHLFANR